MQLSAPTTPTDPTLAAFFAAAGRTFSNDALPGTFGSAPAAGLPPAFADLLSDAGPAPTPIPASCAVIAPDLGAPVAAPTASATIANFPSWLTAEASPANAVIPAAGETLPSTNAEPANLPTAPCAETDNAIETPAPSGPTSAVVPPRKSDRPAKSPKPAAANATPVRTASASAPALAPEAVAASSVATPNASVSSPGAGEPIVPTPADESEPEPDAENQDEKQNLPTAVTPVASRKGGKSPAPPPLPEIPAEAGEAAPAASPLSTATPHSYAHSASAEAHPQPATARAFESLAANFSATSAVASEAPTVRSVSPSPIRRAPVQPAPTLGEISSATVPIDFDPLAGAAPAVSSFAPPAAIRPAQDATRTFPDALLPEISAVSAPQADVDALSLRAEPLLAERRSSDDPARTIRFENSVPTREEIFAALDGNYFPAKKLSATAPEKTFLSTTAKRVATASPELGTDVAKPEPVMSTATLFHRPSFVAPLERAPDVAWATASAASVEASTVAPAVVAQRAVDAVMTAVERFSAGDRHSVQMQFSVGGADLSVRVEMRGDEVRTTFRTDSPELRHALAHEWQAATPDSGDRSVRIAAPVFSANNQSAFPGDSGSRQHDARARRSEAEDVFSAVAARSRAAAFGSAVDLPAAPAARAAASGTALHLSTLA